jgi:hypothetical protein|tara:strand:- start:65 stop:259 length:195 start_codon:yes stop_codon:yes gene_type:complete
MRQDKTSGRVPPHAGPSHHRQGYNDRLDESLSATHGKKSQSLKSRRDESRGARKPKGSFGFGKR